jgi:hypothetical protein
MNTENGPCTLHQRRYFLTDTKPMIDRPARGQAGPTVAGFSLLREDDT